MGTTKNRIISAAFNPQHSVLVITFTVGANLGNDLALELANTGIITGFPDPVSSTLYIRGDFDEADATKLYDRVVQYIRNKQAEEFDPTNVPELQVIPPRQG